MRDLIFSLLVLGMVPVCFRRPFMGLLVFSWLAYMRPQDLTWGFARFQRWSYLIAFVTFLGFIRSRPQQWFMRDWRSYVMMAMAAIVGISVAASVEPDKEQLTKYLEFAKIIVITLFTTVVVQRREQLRMLIWVIALSLGFYGIKSGVWGLMTGLQGRIIRGPGGMMKDNNALALALAMILPLLIVLGRTERRPMVRRAFQVAAPLTCITIVLTHSRGGFLSMAGALGVLIWYSRNRIAVFSAAAVLGLVAVVLAPESYTERITTIAEYKTEGSAAGRIYAWGIGWRMATANPMLGVGLDKFRQHYIEYDPNPTAAKLSGHGIIEAHSSYVEMMAESGFLAFGMYLTLLFGSFATLWRVRYRARHHFQTSWILSYATMLEAGLVAFVIGGTFLNRAHFDLIYHYVAIIMVFGRMAMKEMEDPIAHPLRDGQRGSLVPIQRRVLGQRGPGFGRGFGRAPGRLPTPTASFVERR
mgnify:CR=1 FL=1